MRRSILALALALAASAGAAQATTYVFQTTLSGLNEAPPNASPGDGFATLLWDDVLHSATLDVTFSGLIGATTAAHTHSPTPGQPGPNFSVATTIPTFPGFPSGMMAGTYQLTFATNSAASYNPAYVTAFGGLAAAEQALLDGMLDGFAYLNIHSDVFQGGEIRGNWAGGVVPEPATWALMIAGFGLAGSVLRARRRPQPS